MLWALQKEDHYEIVMCYERHSNTEVEKKFQKYGFMWLVTFSQIWMQMKYAEVAWIFGCEKFWHLIIFQDALSIVLACH